MAHPESPGAVGIAPASFPRS